MIFRDRKEAGQRLASELKGYQGAEDTMVLGLPRGGVIVAYEVAQELGLPLDIVAPRKIPAPGDEELAIGAVSVDGDGVFDQRMIETFGVSKEYLEEAIAEQREEAKRRLKVYRGDRPALDLKGKTAILVDDGIATGATMRVAIKHVKAQGAAKVVVAIPVIAKDTLEKIEADEVVYMDAPLMLGAIGQFYENFEQTSDEEVIELMEKSV